MEIVTRSNVFRILRKVYKVYVKISGFFYPAMKFF